MLEFVQKISQTSGNFRDYLNPDDVLGHSVATIGDLNGDGVVDLAVGSPRSDDGGWENGAIYILFLNSNGTVKSQQKISEDYGNFSVNLQNGDIFGASMTGIGDFNGDGIPDLAVSAYLADDGGIDRGAFYLLYMNTNGTVKSYQKISQTSGNFTGALDNDDAFGRSLANIGDFDGDGVTDLAVGARSDDDGGTDRGAIYILCMNSNGTVKTGKKISSTVGNLTGLRNDDLFGTSTASLGDLDGDGITDLAVGSPLDDDGGENKGALYILFMNSNGTVKSQQKISALAGNFTASLDNNDYFGWSISSLGDFNHDGIVDIAVSAFKDDDGGANRGAVYFLYLNTDGTVQSYQKISDTQGGFSGNLDNEDHFGTAITLLGDLNGNDVPEVVVGAFNDDDGGLDKGAVYVLFPVDPNVAPIAVDDAVATDEETLLTGNVLVDNGYGSDSDPNNDLLTIVAVNESNINVGQTITLASGALLTLNANGSFFYDPNGNFDSVTPGYNVPVTDSFNYTISDGRRLTSNGTVIVTINGVNDTPTIANQSLQVNENSNHYTFVGTLTATDPDRHDTLTYSIIDGDANNIFKLDSASGKVYVLKGQYLNYEVQDRYTLTVKSQDAGGLSDTATITFYINDVNDRPIINNQNFNVDENSNNETLIGKVFATDEDAGQSLTYSIINGNEDNIFALNSVTGQISVADASHLNYEETSQYTLTVQVTDNGLGNYHDIATVVIDVNDLNEAPHINNQSFRVDENSPLETVIGTVEAFDEDAGQSLTYTYSIISGNDAGIFTIDPTTAVLTVIDPTRINYELKNRFTITVKATDDGVNTLSNTALITIDLNDLNDVPVVNNQSMNIAENSANGTIVGTVSATDEDAGQQLTYNLIQGNESNIFAINSTTGVISVKDGSLLNYEANDRYTLTVQVTDNGIGNLSDTATLTINLQNANDAPIVTNSVFNLFDNNSPLSNAFGVNDEDRGDYHTFKVLSQTDYGKLSNNSNGTFTFNLENDFQDLSVGEIRTVNFNYQAIDSRATASNIGTITFNVTGINDRPVVQEMNFSVGEDESKYGNFAGDDIDSDDNPSSLTYTVTNPNNESSMVIGNNGTFNFNPGNAFSDLADGETGQISLTYQATDSHASTSNTGRILISVVGANDNPVATNMSLTVAEDEEALLGGFAGDDIDSDDSQSTLIYTILSNPNYGTISNNNDGTFTFNLGSNFSDLNAGQTRTVSFTYKATDSHWGVSNTASTTITVMGVNNTYTGTNSSEIIVGTDSRDTISGQNGNDVIYGYRGNGVSGVGNNAVAPTVDNSPINDGDILKGGSGNDTLYGGNGNDDLYGGLENDYLWGGNGNDTLRGESSNDHLLGGEGNDLYLWSSGYGRDFYQDIEGFDTLQVQNGDLTLSNSFDTTSNGIDKIVGLGATNIIGTSVTDNWNFQNTILMGIGAIDGQSGHDSIQGSQSNDKLLGGSGSDTLKGNDGVDTINGNSGNDLLTGGFGNDILTGGDGYDRFIFNTANEGVDTITDFNITRDSLGISASGFGGGLTAGTLTTAQFVFGSVATNPQHRCIYNILSGDLFFDSDGNTPGGNAQVLIARFSNLTLLSSKNMAVI